MTSSRKFLVFCLLAIAPALSAQKLEVSFRGYPSSWYNGFFEPALDGGGLALTYFHSLSGNIRLGASAEYDLLLERNECYAGVGILWKFWEHNRFSAHAGASVLNGINLFRPKVLYTGGAEATGRLEFRLSERTALSLTLGARYTLSPAYKNYGVWRHNSWPVGIGISF